MFEAHPSGRRDRASASPAFADLMFLGLITTAVGVGTDAAPAGGPPFVLIDVDPGPAGPHDVLPDGRIIAVVDDQVRLETAPSAGTYDLAGTLPVGLISDFGASFVAVSPDGGAVLVGDNEFDDPFVHLVDVAELDGGPLDPVSFPLPNFQAEWLDETHVAVSGADPLTFLGQVSVLDVGTGATTPLVNIDGASGGVAFADDGSLLTGNGFDFDTTGGTVTGEIRAFPADDVSDVLDGLRGPFDLATEGTFVGIVLSASSLEFDDAGNLFVGGGNEDEPESFAIADAAAAADAIAGIDPLEEADLFRRDPETFDFSFYGGVFDSVTGDWIVTGFGAPIAWRYEATGSSGRLPVAGPPLRVEPTNIIGR